MASTARTFGPFPADYTGGSFSWAGSTGIIAAGLAANAELFQFRWASTTKNASIQKISIAASVTTTMFAAGVPAELSLVKSTAFTVAGTGGTDITFAALNKRKTSMTSSVITAGDVRIGTTAGLGAGTKVLETYPLATIVAACPITGALNGTIVAPGTVLFQADPSKGVHPIVLVANEGLSITSVAIAATGTWRLSVNIDWSEVTVY